MKTACIRLSLVGALMLGLALNSGPAMAWGGGWHGGGGGWHGGWRGGDGWHGDGGWRGDWHGGWGDDWGWGLGAGLLTGAAIGAAMSVPADPYYYPAYPQAVIVQPPPAAPAQPAVGTWYYCTSARAYYPYVSSCPEPWRAVPAVPPDVPGN